MSLVERTCEQCRRSFQIERGQVNAGRGRYCARDCFWESRRKPPVPIELTKAMKREYDIEYRRKNAEYRKAQKAAYYARTKDRDKERAIREANKEAIAAYKREYYAKPENKAAKYQYDHVRRCKMKYGPFWEASSVLISLENEIRRLMPDYDIRLINKTGNKTQRRKRAYAAAQRQELERLPLGGLAVCEKRQAGPRPSGRDCIAGARDP